VRATWENGGSTRREDSTAFPDNGTGATERTETAAGAAAAWRPGITLAADCQLGQVYHSLSGI